MKAWQLTSQTGPAALQMVEIPEPVAGPGQVLVRIRAVALNYRDQMVADGRYGRVNLPLVPLSDGAGEIVAAGAGVTRWQPGDRVAGSFFQGWTTGPFRREHMGTALGGALPGMLAEYVVLGERGLVGVPAHLDFNQAATLPCAALTAWHALVVCGKINAGETVLLLGTGGVSLFALQFQQR
jgi:NADPH:quinone reductase-like Zn-dependent oxidoreductase